jgi:hypothetical protein
MTKNWYGHAVVASLGLATILEVIAISRFVPGLWYAGGAVAMVGSVIPGFIYLQNEDKMTTPNMGFLVLVFMTTLLLMLIPAAPTVMTVLSWLTGVGCIALIWMGQVGSLWSRIGYSLGYFLYQIGVTGISGGFAAGSIITLLILGTLIGIGSFYFEHFKFSSRFTPSSSKSTLTVITV